MAGRSFYATDPHDEVYAFLGLVHGGRQASKQGSTL